MISRWLVAASFVVVGCDSLGELADEVGGIASEGAPSEDDVPAGDEGPAPAEADSDPTEDELIILDEPQGVVLEPPTEPLPDPRTRAEADAPRDRRARAWQFNAPIYVEPGSDDILGFSRRGAVIDVTRARKAAGCSLSWWELSTGGWVCPRKGWAVSFDPAPLEEHLQTLPPKDTPLPFGYAKIRDAGTPIYSRLPTPDEEAAAKADEDGTPGPVTARSAGVVFIALHREETREDGTVFLRDVRGRYVRKDGTHPPKIQTMRAEPLSKPGDLPIAFVFEDEAELRDLSGERIGVANKFARQRAEGLSDDGAWVDTPEGRLPAASVRIAELVKRPDGVDGDDQWVHVDLDRQVLVAYEGDTPVLATLVSSGKEGYEPPRGLFRIEKKYTSKKMQGDDPVDGSYDIDQVPYTMYYWGSLALHGAYWHDGFGKVRSHGCTNLPPHDARWLFRWAEPALRPAWHGRVRAVGPHVYMTRGEDVYVQPLSAQRENG